MWSRRCLASPAGGDATTTRFTAAGVVLVLVALTGGRAPASTAILGCVLLWLVVARAGRTARSPLVAGFRADPLAGVHRGGAAAGGLEVRWWRRDGHDRLYVSDAAGRSLGWLDRGSGRLEVFDEQDRPAVERGLRS